MSVENPVSLLCIPCRFEGCEQRWHLAVEQSDGEILRFDVVEIMTIMATHCRDEHGDEEAALRCERLALSL